MDTSGGSLSDKRNKRQNETTNYTTSGLKNLKDLSLSGKLYEINLIGGRGISRAGFDLSGGDSDRDPNFTTKRSRNGNGFVSGDAFNIADAADTMQRYDGNGFNSPDGGTKSGNDFFKKKNSTTATGSGFKLNLNASRNQNQNRIGNAKTEREHARTKTETSKPSGFVMNCFDRNERDQAAAVLLQNE